MKFFSANLQDLRELYVNNLQKAFDMEQHINQGAAHDDRKGHPIPS